MAQATSTDDRESERLDPHVFDRLEPLTETWRNDHGKRLYRLFPDEGQQSRRLLSNDMEQTPPIHAITKYERSIDEQTGQTVETETVEQIGSISASVDIRREESRIYDTLNVDAVGWEEVDVEMFREEFETYLEDRLAELMETEDGRVFDLHHHDAVRIPVDLSEEAERLSERSSLGSKSEWEGFLWAVTEHTTYIHNIHSESVAADRAYSFRPEFESVPEWRLRAVENYHCGAFMDSTALAEVAALMDSDVCRTQKGIADKLGKTEGTVSRQVSKVQEMRERVQWEMENRIR